VSSLESSAESDSAYFELSAQLLLDNQERYFNQVKRLLDSKEISGQFNEFVYQFAISGDGVDFSYAPIGESDLHKSSWLRLNEDKDLAVDALIQFMAHAEAEMTLFQVE
jgi:hypothetical protein